MDKNELAFCMTFQQTLSCAKRLVTSTLAHANRDLRKLLAFALHNQTPSEYPFVLKYAFCRQDRDGEKILKIAAAVDLLQQSTFVTDDIFDSADLRYGTRPLYLQYGVNSAIITAELLQTIALRCITEQLGRCKFSNTAVASKLFNQIVLDVYIKNVEILPNIRPQNAPAAHSGAAVRQSQSKEMLNCFLRNNMTRETGIREVATVIRNCGVLEASKGIAQRYLNRSLQSISKLPPSVTVERFRWLAGGLLKAQGLE